MTTASRITPRSESSAQRLAAELVSARKSRTQVVCGDATPLDLGSAYAVQDETLRLLGPVGGWKVGAAGPTVEPTCGPLPAAGIIDSPASLASASWLMRGVELEVAIRLNGDLPPREKPYLHADIESAIASVLPAIELLETRLANWADAGRYERLADLQSHGALICGSPLPVDPSDVLDLSRLEAMILLDGVVAAKTCGGNPAADAWRLLVWLANHCSRRGYGLWRGQVITTGSCTGITWAGPAASVQGRINSWDAVTLRFEGKGAGAT